MVDVDFQCKLSQSSDELSDQVHSAVFHCDSSIRFVSTHN